MDSATAALVLGRRVDGVKARIEGAPPPGEAVLIRPEAAVLVLVAEPGYVLLVRKSCELRSPWACDVALPGGHIGPGEGEVDAALREAWEEAGIPRAHVRVLCLAPLHATSKGAVVVRPVIATPRGPLCARPGGGEVDRVFWARLGDIVGSPPRRIRHPRGRAVVGVELPGGLVVWGLTLRILTWLSSALPMILEDPGEACGDAEGAGDSGGRR